MLIQFFIGQIFHRFVLFFNRWYRLGSIKFWVKVFDWLEALDHTWAIRINVRLWLQPLYGDYTAVGRIVGPIFRTARIIIAAILYLVILTGALAVWLIWISIPVFIALKIILG